MTEQKQNSFSFGFSKKKESSKLVKSAIGEETKEDIKVTEFVTSLEDKAVVSTKPKEEKKELVIPLITTNKWQVPTPQDLEKSSESSRYEKQSGQRPQLSRTGDEITDQALQEIITEANKQQDDWDERGGSKASSREIPLLMKNKPPDGTETDDKLDVSIRPDEAATADYDQVPIEEYGMALLRGMGFKEGEGIGKNKKSVAPVVAVARPKGLGLGADRSLTLQQKDASNASNKESQSAENLEMKKGSFCVVQAGKHEGFYAMVEGIDEDNSRVVVKLAIGNTILTLNQMAIKLVTRKDFDRNSKYLNKTKVDEYKEKESKKHRDRDRSRSRDRDSGHDSDRRSHQSDKKHSHKDRYRDEHRDADRHRDQYSSSKRQHHESNHYSDSDGGLSRKKDRHSHRDRSPLREEPSSKHRPRDSGNSEPSTKTEISSKSSWIRPNLKVRIVDKKYRNGDYYKSKVFVDDVFSLDLCTCRTEKGKLLEGLALKYLETVIPKDKESPVMVVSGKHKGKVGRILEKDSTKYTALVQILPDCDEILSLDYDLICEYAGSIQDFC